MPSSSTYSVNFIENTIQKFCIFNVKQLLLSVSEPFRPDCDYS